jgi:hypothetical protein
MNSGCMSLSWSISLRLTEYARGGRFVRSYNGVGGRRDFLGKWEAYKESSASSSSSDSTTTGAIGGATVTEAKGVLAILGCT